MATPRKFLRGVCVFALPKILSAGTPYTPATSVVWAIRWNARGACPRSALAETPCADGAVWLFLMSALVQVEHAMRAPPFGTRKSSRAAHCLFFFCPPILRFMRRGVGYPVEHAMRAPRSALAKAAVLRTVFFSFAHPFCALCAEVWAKEKQPLAGLLLLVGAGGRTRTDTDFTPQDFESSASASFTFTTPAQITIYHSVGELTSVFATARNVLRDVSCGRREGRMLRGECGAGRAAENFEKMCELAYANLLTRGEREAYNSCVKSE